MKTFLSAFLAAVVLIPCLTPPVRAALGEDATVVDRGGARLKLAVRQPAATSWRAQDITLGSGTVVHEYLDSASGKVFAVSWRGPVPPDLKQFLGGYFGRYQAAAQAPAVRRRQVRVSDPDLVILSSGRIRNFTGSAWLPARLPADFSWP